MRRRCLAFSDKKSEKIVFGNNSSSYAMVPHQTALNFISLSIRCIRCPGAAIPEIIVSTWSVAVKATFGYYKYLC